MSCLFDAQQELSRIFRQEAGTRLHHRIEKRFARRKEWRRVAAGYDRCPILFLFAGASAATVTEGCEYWL